MTGSTANLSSGSARTVTATVTDAAGNGVSGQTVTFSQSGSGTVSGLTSPVTNASGVANDVVTGLLAGSVTVTATDGGLNDSLTFPVVFGAVNHLVLAPATQTIDSRIAVIHHDRIRRGWQLDRRDRRRPSLDHPGRQL